MSNNSIKTYYLDPDILLQAPTALLAFDENTVVLPGAVFETLNVAIKKSGEVGKNAQDALNILNSILSTPMKGKKHIWHIRLGEANSGHLIVDGAGKGGLVEQARRFAESHAYTTEPYQYSAAESYGDSGVLSGEITLVTQNPALQAEARYHGLAVETYRGNIQTDKAPYTGRRVIYLPPEAIECLYKTRSVVPDKNALPKSDDSLVHNEYVTVKSTDGGSTSAMAYYDANDGMLHAIEVYTGGGVYGVRAKNAGQHFALDALMRPVENCPLVVIQGGAGTAKTFLALAAGLEQTVGDSPRYRRLLVVRPNVKFDATLGFLKGGEAEKIAPLIRPIMDNIDQLTVVKVDKSDYLPQPRKGKRHQTDTDAEDKIVAPNSYAQDLFDSGRIVAQSMEYMRGRSITDTYIIIDEAQNMTPEQAFGIVSRAGKGTKIILEGDPNQVDNPSLSAQTNGLTWASQCMKGSKLCAQLTFTDAECERSALAAEAIQKMSLKGTE